MPTVLVSVLPAATTRSLTWVALSVSSASMERIGRGPHPGQDHLGAYQRIITAYRHPDRAAGRAALAKVFNVLSHDVPRCRLSSSPSDEPG